MAVDNKYTGAATDIKEPMCFDCVKFSSGSNKHTFILQRNTRVCQHSWSVMRYIKGIQDDKIE